MCFRLLLFKCDYFALVFVFFFNDTATTEIYTLSLHDALPISKAVKPSPSTPCGPDWCGADHGHRRPSGGAVPAPRPYSAPRPGAVFDGGFRQPHHPPGRGAPD